MKYALLVYGTESCWTPEEWKECVEQSAAICEELAAQKKLLAASPLHPVATSTTVRVREGKNLITAGPFAETAEQLGGFYLLDVEDLDEAISIASRIPPAKVGTVEIRPVRELPELPESKLSSWTIPTEGDLKKYMLLCYDDEVAWRSVGEEAHMAAMQQAVLLCHKLDQVGRYIQASPLHSVETATSVRVRNGQKIVTDGPFAETTEVLGGYYLILAKDLAEAMDLASVHPGVFVGAVEVRQLVDIPSANHSS